ncbi:hypothetical protein RB2083_397 [Rhodobacteraceae bacterium HTCC2083]|nr:hypothetical protein RB2083_397 [Rhodobacteraceae bacterium HTCC2083]
MNLNVIAHKEPINLNASISRTLRQKLRRFEIFKALKKAKFHSPSLAASQI